MGYLDSIITMPTTPKTAEEYVSDSLNQILEGEQEYDYKAKSPMFSADIYGELAGEKLLPYCISRGCEYYTGVQRDMYLVASLIGFSSIFPKVYTKYFGKTVYANLYGFILAGAATGKNAVATIEDILSGIQEYKKREWEELCLKVEEEANKDEANKSNKFETPTPLKHIIPLNLTGASFTQLLEANNNVFGYTTEIDEFTSSMQNQYGTVINSLLRKVYHHEKTASYRSTNKEDLELNRVRLSLLLAGTPQQFHKMMPSVENGLFSRFCVYSAHEQPSFKDPFAKKYNDFEKVVAELKDHTTTKYLSYMEKGREFKFTEQQQQTFIEAGKKELTYYTKLLGDEAASIINRHFFMINRIAMTLTCCKHEASMFDNEIICRDTEFMLAFEIFNTIKIHAFNMFNMVESNVKEKKAKVSEKGKNMRFYEELPQNFTIEEAYIAGKSLNYANKTVRNKLSLLKNQGLLVSGKQKGMWEKAVKS